MNSRPGQVPSGQPRTWRQVPPPPIRGAESPPPPEPTPPTPPAPPPPGDEHDPARARALIDKLRPFETEAKRLAKENADLAAKLKAVDDAQLSETEKLTKRAADAENALADAQAAQRTLLVRTEIERQARKLGIVDEDAAYRLLDLGALEFEEDGTPKNVEKVLTKLLEAKPYLKAPEGSRPGLPPTPRANGTTPDQKVDDAYQKMKTAGIGRRF